MNDFIKRIISLRISNGLNQKEMAAKVGLSASTFRALEYGRSVCLRNVLKLLQGASKAFDTSMAYLVTGEENPDTHKISSAVNNLIAASENLKSMLKDFVLQK